MMTNFGPGVGTTLDAAAFNALMVDLANGSTVIFVVRFPQDGVIPLATVSAMTNDLGYNWDRTLSSCPAYYRPGNLSGSPLVLKEVPTREIPSMNKGWSNTRGCR